MVASPTYKATYTGLLKLFLDQIGTGDLAGVVAVPLMLGAGPGHALAPDLLLKPVLVELGATTPTQGLYLIDRAWDDPGPLDDVAGRGGAAGGGSDLDDDLAARPAGRQVVDGGGRLGQRERAVDRRRHLPGLDEPGEDDEVRGVLAGDEEAEPLPDERRQRGRPQLAADAQPAPAALAADDDQRAVRGQACRSRRSGRLPADVEDDVVARGRPSVTSAAV